MLTRAIALSLAASILFAATSSAAEKRDEKALFHVVTNPLKFVFECAGGIIGTAMYASATEKRELTWNEAVSCGSYYWTSKVFH